MYLILCAMVLILEGISEKGAQMWSETVNFICFISKKGQFSFTRAQRVLSYHLIYKFYALVTQIATLSNKNILHVQEVLTHFML